MGWLSATLKKDPADIDISADEIHVSPNALLVRMREEEEINISRLVGEKVRLEGEIAERQDLLRQTLLAIEACQAAKAVYDRALP